MIDLISRSVVILRSKNLFFSLSSSVIIIAVFAVVIMGVLGFGESARAETLIDYENGSLFSASGGYFRYYAEDRSILTLDATQGFDNTDQSLNVNTLMDNFHIWWIQNDIERTLIPEGLGCDRMSFFIKIPDNYPLDSDYNFHVGTYTRDPEIPSNIQGQHYYHYLNIQGSDYPTKIVLNQHPQHRTGSSDTIEDNPETWNYYDGFTRFYMILLPLYECPISLPFISHVDEVKFYSISEPENDETINSISCTYFGDGTFQIGWHGSSQYSDGNCDDHTFEVRYSTSPITNADYASTVIVPGSPFSQYPSSYNFWQANFTIPITSGTAYFAIKDLDSASPYVSKIDYPIDYMDLSITTSSLPEAIIGEAYSQSVSVTGGNTPYSYSIISGSLPNGLNLNSNTGLISGTPTQIGTSNFTIQVTDNDSSTDTQNLSITVNNPDTTPPTISNIQATNILSESATITWTTNENANSQVQYGTSPGGYSNTETDSNYVTSHSIVIYGLNENTTYYYQVSSADQSNNNTNSAEYSFTTAVETSTTLIDFGDSEANNAYGLENWSTPIKDSYTNYRAIGPGGTTITSGSNGGYNYQGVQGTSKQFSNEDVIKVNWYNNSSNAITFTPRISFTDSDRYDGDSVWYNMTTTTIQPNSTAYSDYAINSSSAGDYNLVNVNVNYDNTEVLICDNVKLMESSSSPSTTYTITNFINLVANWLTSGSGLESDVNNDGVVNTRDLGIMMSNWSE